MMNEGKARIVLLDDRPFDILIQENLYSGELLDIVASYIGLVEKEYFGISYKDSNNNIYWLQLDRKVLEHSLPTNGDVYNLCFTVRFFIESITYLKDNITIELFFLQSKLAISKSLIEFDSTTVFDLAAYALQATFGDYSSDSLTKEYIARLSVIPADLLKDLSQQHCEDQIIAYYKLQRGELRGSAIVNYMSIIESFPTYGVHYYEVRDKSSTLWWLGLGHQGISLYEHQDKKSPKKVFAWKQLENLYFRNKKFSIEVHDPKRVVNTLSSFNLYEDAIHEPIERFDSLSNAICDPTTQVSVSKRSFAAASVNVHAWFADTAELTKCIWAMAVSQHQFFLERQISKQNQTWNTEIRSMAEIANTLVPSANIVPPAVSLSTPSDNTSLASSSSSVNVKDMDNSIEARLQRQQQNKELIVAMKAKKEFLTKDLAAKKLLFKELCMQEGNITGVVPTDMPLEEGELPPTFRRRINTGFKLSSQVVNNSNTDKSSNNSRDRDNNIQKHDSVSLKLEYELQEQIVKAALRLAEDKSMPKNVRKTRQKIHSHAANKLKNLEKKLKEHQNNKSTSIHVSYDPYDMLSVQQGISLTPKQIQERSNSSNQMDQLHVLPNGGSTSFHSSSRLAEDAYKDQNGARRLDDFSLHPSKSAIALSPQLLPLEPKLRLKSHSSMHYQPTFSPTGTPHHLSHYTGPLPRPTAQHYGTSNGGDSPSACNAGAAATNNANEYEYDDKHHHHERHHHPDRHHEQPLYTGDVHNKHRNPSSPHLSDHHNHQHQHHGHQINTRPRYHNDSSPHPHQSPHSASVDPPRYVTMHRRQTPASRDMYISPGKFSGLHNSTSDLLYHPSGGINGSDDGAGNASPSGGSVGAGVAASNAVGSSSASSSSANLFASDPTSSHPFKRRTNLERSASIHLHECTGSTTQSSTSSTSQLSSKPFVMADFYKYSDRYQPPGVAVQYGSAPQHNHQYAHPPPHQEHHHAYHANDVQSAPIQQRLHHGSNLPGSAQNRNSISSNNSSQDGSTTVYAAGPVPRHRGIIDELYNRQTVTLDRKTSKRNQQRNDPSATLV